jgi:hypothetical protein
MGKDGAALETWTGVGHERERSRRGTTQREAPEEGGSS